MTEGFVELLVTLLTQSLLAIGGIYVVLGDLHRVVVGGALLDQSEFTALFALAQASPGPNMQFVTLLGWRLGGVAGDFLATACFLVPALTLVGIVARAWDRWGEQRWFVLLRRGLVPLTIGLMLSSAWLLASASAATASGFALVAASAGLTLFTKTQPLVILAIAGALGALGLV